MTLYGYTRVSSKEQKSNYSLEIQKQLLISHGVLLINIHSEIDSGIKETSNRSVFNNLLALLKTGDQIFVTRLDRFSRSLLDGIKTISELNQRGVSLVSLDLPVINNPEMAQFFFNVLLVFGNFEFQRRLARQKEGIAKAKLDFKYKGRKTKINESNIKQLEHLVTCSLSRIEIMPCMKISNSTYYKLRKEIEKSLLLDIQEINSLSNISSRKEQKRQILSRLDSLEKNLFWKDKILILKSKLDEIN